LSVLMMKEKNLVINWHCKDYDTDAIYRKLVTHFGEGPRIFSNDEVTQTPRLRRWHFGSRGKEGKGVRRPCGLQHFDNTHRVPVSQCSNACRFAEDFAVNTLWSFTKKTSLSNIWGGLPTRWMSMLNGGKLRWQICLVSWGWFKSGIQRSVFGILTDPKEWLKSTSTGRMIEKRI
jgi:hypothetical protein